MKNNIKDILQLSVEELKSKVGKTKYEIFLNIFKMLLLFFSLWILFVHFLGFNVLKNSYPYVLWLLSGFVPCIYVLDVLIGSFKYKYDKPFEVINLSSFILFSILTFIEIIIFRICGYEIDFYYFGIIVYMILSFVFLQLCSILIINIGKISEKLNQFLYLFLIPVICFSGLFFSKADLHNKILKMFLKINPIYYLIHGFRKSLIYKKGLFTQPVLFANFIIVNIVIILICFILNKLNKRK